MTLGKTLTEPLNCRKTMKKAITSFNSRGCEVVDASILEIAKSRNMVLSDTLSSSIEEALNEGAHKDPIMVKNLVVLQIAVLNEEGKGYYKLPIHMSKFDSFKNTIRKNTTL